LASLSSFGMEQALDGKYLGTITTDFIKVADKLKEASYLIRERGGYQYPIFPLAQTPVELGPLLVDKNELGNQWHYYAAYLDALVECGLIHAEKVLDFKHSYKDPDEYCCLLVIDQDFTSFVYIPYPVD
jgi:hypothetical protein